MSQYRDPAWKRPLLLSCLGCEATCGEREVVCSACRAKLPACLRRQLGHAKRTGGQRTLSRVAESISIELAEQRLVDPDPEKERTRVRLRIEHAAQRDERGLDTELVAQFAEAVVVGRIRRYHFGRMIRQTLASGLRYPAAYLSGSMRAMLSRTKAP